MRKHTSGSSQSSRKLGLIKACNKSKDPHTPQTMHNSTRWMGYPANQVGERGESHRAVFYTQPALSVCTPGVFMGQDLLKELEAAALTTFPKPVKTNKKKPSSGQANKDQTKPKRKSKGMAALTGETAVLKATKNIKKEEKFDLEGFDLAMFVMHPFLRLVSSYSRIRDDSNTQLSEKIKALVGKDFTFEKFVNFVVQPESMSSQDPKNEVLSARKLWQSYNFDCLVCNEAFYPDVIFKVDEEDFEEELEAFFEDYALDAVGEEALEKFTSGMISLVPSDSEVNNLMGQLPRSMLNQLVDYYRVDLEMFGYPVKQFFHNQK